jgi:hypothetical protein
MRWRSEGITGTGDLHAVQDLKQLPFYCVDDLGYFEFLDIFAVLVSMAAVRWGQLVKGRVALSSNAYMDTVRIIIACENQENMPKRCANFEK